MSSVRSPLDAAVDETCLVFQCHQPLREPAEDGIFTSIVLLRDRPLWSRSKRKRSKSLVNAPRWAGVVTLIAALLAFAAAGFRIYAGQRPQAAEVAGGAFCLALTGYLWQSSRSKSSPK